MRRLVLAAAVALAIAGPAGAVDRSFDLIGSNGKTSIFVDLNSKTANPPLITYWTLAVGIPPAANTNSNIHYMFTKVVVNCTSKTARTLEMVAYDDKNQLAGTWTSPNAEQPIIPNSFFDTEYKYMCLGQRPFANFKLLSHVKDAVAYGDNIKPPSDAPSPND